LRIREKFKDGDKVTVYLKDKGKPHSSFEEEDWYTKAFGAKRNIMKINFKVRFTTEIPKFENYAF
jgi:hypothetical protein